MKKRLVPILTSLFCYIAVGVSSAIAAHKISDVEISSLDSAKLCSVRSSDLEKVAEHFNVVIHDQKGSGHTSKKHIGIPASELFSALDKEKKRGPFTSYYDQATADHVIKLVLEKDSPRILSWLNSFDSYDKLKLRYKASAFIGYGVMRGAKEPKDTYDFVVILKKSADCGFTVLTSYPLLQ